MNGERLPQEYGAVEPYVLPIWSYFYHFNYNISQVGQPSDRLYTLGANQVDGQSTAFEASLGRVTSQYAARLVGMVPKARLGVDEGVDVAFAPRLYEVGRRVPAPGEGTV